MKKRMLISVLLVVALSGFVMANLSPKIALDSDLVACENAQFSHKFSIEDSDSQYLETDISPKKIFYSKIVSQEGEFLAEIFSDNITKEEVGIYERVISATDGNSVDFKNIKIKVLPVNSPPQIEDTTIKTISINDDPKFARQFLATDLEDAQDKLSFNLNFKSGIGIFEISKFGFVDYTAPRADVGVYSIEVCVRDSGLQDLDPASQIVCDETGEQKIACDDFQLTIAEKNRQPTIISKSPALQINTSVKQNLLFNITAFDPDGSSPDVYWYVDGVLAKFESGLDSLIKTFSHSFSCKEYGSHEIKAEITDGLLKDSVVWKIKAERLERCIDSVKAEVFCEELWACSDWNVCQHATQSLQFGTLPEEDYQKIASECNSLNLPVEQCGFQIRSCEDFNSCKKENLKPAEIKACKFSLNPSCSDGLKNCHDSTCEIGVDCGGSCGACPTCFDGFRNQNEEGIDCNGVCSNQCPTEQEIENKKIFTYLSVAIVVILLLLLLIKLFKVMKMEKELKSKNE